MCTPLSHNHFPRSLRYHKFSKQFVHENKQISLIYTDLNADPAKFFTRKNAHLNIAKNHNWFPLNKPSSCSRRYSSTRGQFRERRRDSTFAYRFLFITFIAHRDKTRSRCIYVTLGVVRHCLIAKRSSGKTIMQASHSRFRSIS